MAPQEVHPPQLRQLLGFPRGGRRRKPPPQAVAEVQTKPTCGALCCPDAEQMCACAGVGRDGTAANLSHTRVRDTRTLQRQVCRPDEGVVSFLLQGECPLCNSAAAERTSLFQGTLERGRSGFFFPLSSNIPAYLFSFRSLQPR